MLTNHSNQLLVENPPGGDWERGIELARILEDGAFTDKHIGVDFKARDRAASESSLAGMGTLVQASIISEAWNIGHMAFVK